MGYLGVDVAKDSLEVADTTGSRRRSFQLLRKSDLILPFPMTTMG